MPKQMRRPSTAIKTDRQAVILFADLMNSSLFSDTLGLYEYDDFVDKYQLTMQKAAQLVFSLRDVSQEDGTIEISIRGDEACIILYSGNIEEDILTAILLACCMKVMWLQSSFNLGRLGDGKIASDIGIGIHTGKVIIRPRLARANDARAEGYAINLAKRIEG